VPNVTPEAALSTAYVNVTALRKRIDQLTASRQNQKARELEMATLMPLYGEPVDANLQMRTLRNLSVFGLGWRQPSGISNPKARA